MAKQPKEKDVPTLDTLARRLALVEYKLGLRETHPDTEKEPPPEE